MKTELALVALLALAGTALFFQQESPLQAGNSDYEVYAQWKAQMNKNTNGSEDKFRFAVFQENLRFIENWNKSGSKTVLGLTEFADMTNEEFAASKTTQITQGPANTKVASNSKPVNAPSQWNWVDQGVVSPIKNQGNCGSCWAFSAVSQLEGLNAINNGNLEQFSEQQVTSCTPFPFSLGCNGGNSLFAFLYTAQAGIESEEAYPYVQENNPKTAECEYDSSKVVFTNEGAGQVPANSPSDMQTQLLVQPLSIAVEASGLVFQLYTSGVLDSKNCGTNLDHAISLVGYNFEGNNNYWIVRNSWGTSWGQKGYAWIENVEGDGICGINMDVTYPTQAK